MCGGVQVVCGGVLVVCGGVMVDHTTGMFHLRVINL